MNEQPESGHREANIALLYRPVPENEYHRCFDLGVGYSLAVLSGPEPGTLAVLRLPADFNPGVRHPDTGLVESSLDWLLGEAVDPIIISLDSRLRSLARLWELAEQQRAEYHLRTRAAERLFRRAARLLAIVEAADD